MAHDCPRCEGLPNLGIDFSHWPDDGTCHHCGSLRGDVFMARLEAGDVELGPTDKNYKVYVHNKGGAKFKHSHSGKMDDLAGRFMCTTDERDEAKFYFQHLTEDQMKRFVELLNEKKLKIGEPGYFYQQPYFIASG